MSKLYFVVEVEGEREEKSFRSLYKGFDWVREILKPVYSRFNELKEELEEGDYQIWLRDEQELCLYHSDLISSIPEVDIPTEWEEKEMEIKSEIEDWIYSISRLME